MGSITGNLWILFLINEYTASKRLREEPGKVLGHFMDKWNTLEHPCLTAFPCLASTTKGSSIENSCFGKFLNYYYLQFVNVYERQV